MKNPTVDGLLALTPQEIKIVYWRCRGETVEETAKKVPMAASTVYKTLKDVIYPTLGIEGWDDIKAEVCRPLLAMVNRSEDLNNWPEGHREKLEALRDPKEPPEPPPSPIPPPQTIPGSRVPWPFVAIPLLVLCLLCIAGVVFARPIFQNIFRTSAVQATQSPENLIPPTSTTEPSPTIQLTGTSANISTATFTQTPTLAPAATLTPMSTETKSPIGLEVGEELSDNRVTLKLIEVRYDQGKTRVGSGIAPIAFGFEFANHSGETIRLELEERKFQVEDNTGASYNCEFWDVSGTVPTLFKNVENGQTFGIGAFCGDGTLLPQVETVTLYITDLSSLPDSTWVHEIAR